MKLLTTADRVNTVQSRDKQNAFLPGLLLGLFLGLIIRNSSGRKHRQIIDIPGKHQ